MCGVYAYESFHELWWNINPKTVIMLKVVSRLHCEKNYMYASQKHKQ